MQCTSCLNELTNREFLLYEILCQNCIDSQCSDCGYDGHISCFEVCDKCLERMQENE